MNDTAVRELRQVQLLVLHIELGQYFLKRFLREVVMWIYCELLHSLALRVSRVESTEHGRNRVVLAFHLHI